MKPGNKQNAFLNGEWARHMRRWGKKYTARKRRSQDRKIIQSFFKE